MPVSHTDQGPGWSPTGVRAEPENLVLCFVLTRSWVPLPFQCVPSADHSYASLLGTGCLGKNCHQNGGRGGSNAHHHLQSWTAPPPGPLVAGRTGWADIA